MGDVPAGRGRRATPACLVVLVSSLAGPACSGTRDAAETLPPATAAVPAPAPPAPAGPPRRVVVLDPGHGGTDEGAHGVSGAKEKDLTLAIALQTRAALAGRPGVEVVLTREKDRDVSLPERTDLARSRGADLFVSIHANSNPDATQSGIETYHLDTASDDAAARLAARENASLAEVPPGTASGDVARILGDLRTQGQAMLSRQLAAAVQERLVSGLASFYAPEPVRDRGVRSALFYVLVVSDVPAILLETAFLTHPKEEQRLRTRAYQEQVASLLADALDAWSRGQGPAGGAGDETVPRVPPVPHPAAVVPAER